MHRSPERISSGVALLKGSIVQKERLHQCPHSLLIGDFNLNPFDQGLSSRDQLCGLMDEKASLRLEKKYIKQGRGRDSENPIFYNPMWGCFGDRTQGPPATYRYVTQSHRDYLFYMFDQMMLRPSILKHLIKYPNGLDIQIIDTIRSVPLISKRGIPLSGFSDHLPIVGKLNFKAGSTTRIQKQRHGATK
jgi:hypothetical protein